MFLHHLLCLSWSCSHSLVQDVILKLLNVLANRPPPFTRLGNVRLPAFMGLQRMENSVLVLLFHHYSIIGQPACLFLPAMFLYYLQVQTYMWFISETIFTTSYMLFFCCLVANSLECNINCLVCQEFGSSAYLFLYQCICTSIYSAAVIEKTLQSVGYVMDFNSQ